MIIVKWLTEDGLRFRNPRPRYERRKIGFINSTMKYDLIVNILHSFCRTSSRCVRIRTTPPPWTIGVCFTLDPNLLSTFDRWLRIGLFCHFASTSLLHLQTYRLFFPFPSFLFTILSGKILSGNHPIHDFWLYIVYRVCM